ncbi:MAG TPA: hypothetical protein V6C85_39105 [Allocoleopsis sp.]
MAPRKLINKSRGIGEKKKRGRPPKNSKPVDSTPAPVDATPAPLATTNGRKGSNGNSGGNGSVASTAATAAIAYTDLSQVNHGLTFPTFEPNQYFATDLFSNSSSLPETEKEVADAAVESIEKKRHTLRIVGANIALNTDVVKTANDYKKFEGFVIDYGTTLVNNETKFINYQTAGVNRDIAINRFEQTQERLIQGQKTLAGMRSITPLIDDEWAARRSLKQSQIKSLEVAAIQAKEALEPKLMQISQDFRQELSDLN